MATPENPNFIPVKCEHWSFCGKPGAGCCAIGKYNGFPNRPDCRRCLNGTERVQTPLAAGSINVDTNTRRSLVQAVRKPVQPRQAPAGTPTPAADGDCSPPCQAKKNKIIAAADAAINPVKAE